MGIAEGNFRVQQSAVVDEEERNLWNRRCFGMDLHRTQVTHRGHSNIPSTKETTLSEAAVFTGWLLDRRVSTEAKDRSMRTPLHCAAIRDNIAVAEVLLNRGAAPDGGGEHYWTPLHLAAKCGQEAMTLLLLSRGATIDARTSSPEDESGYFIQTPLNVAAKSGHETIVEILLDRGAASCDPQRPWTTLHVAAKYGQEEIVKLLLDRGADIRAEN